LFVAEDLKSARFLAYEKDYFRELEASAAEQNLRSIKSGRLEDVEVGSVYLDVLRDTKAINSCLVGATAYPILAKHNELLPNRLCEGATDIAEEAAGSRGASWAATHHARPAMRGINEPAPNSGQRPPLPKGER